MIPQAARRRACQRIRSSIEFQYSQLNLPWLCPAVEARRTQRRKSSFKTLSARPARPKAKDLAGTHSHKRDATRDLATAAETAPSHDVGDDYIPFVEQNPAVLREMSTARRTHNDVSLAKLKPFDSHKILTLPVATGESADLFKRRVGSTFNGDVAELQQSLYACVRVGLLDRAAVHVRRLGELFEPEAPQVIDAHHRYLTGLMDVLLAHPSRQRFNDMQRWFEIDLVGTGIKPSSAILSLMLKGAFTVLDKSRLERTIRRYLQVAYDRGDDVLDDTVSSDIFTDSEWEKILDLSPQWYHSSVEEVSVPDRSSHAVSIEGQGNIVPTLREADLKGSGLLTLKQSLLSLSPENKDLESTFAENEPHKIERQRRLEQDVLDAALERWNDESKITQDMRTQGRLQDPRLGSYVHEWIKTMAGKVREEMRLAETTEEGRVTNDEQDRVILAPFLKGANVEKLCAATVLSFMSALPLKKDDTNYPTLTRVIISIGSRLNLELKRAQVEEAANERFHNLPTVERRRRVKLLMKSRSAMTDMLVSQETQHRPKRAIVEIPGVELQSKLGAMFLSLLLNIAKLPVTRTDPDTGKKSVEWQPAGTYSWTYKAGRKFSVLKPNTNLLERLRSEPVSHYIAKFIPMVVQPRKWRSNDEGPYLFSQVPMVRSTDTSASQREYIEMARKRGDMKQVSAGLDIIGKVPWTINRPVFDVLAELWNTGKQVANLAPEHPIAHYPAEPDSNDKAAHVRWKDRVRQIENEITGYHSERCYQNFQLEVARNFLEEKFYTPHNLDFRGRAYPIPPYLNHMNADHIRGLFRFAEGKRLGENGLIWLKIHLANVYGFDKDSLRGRETFTTDHLEDVIDSAVNPITGRQWWLTAEDPFQCLAACVELKMALDEPDPADFVSHLPVQQDGSCNGLQHYAALGGDKAGARQVNLEPGDRPADIYSGVAELVKEAIKEDAEKGHAAAKVLHGRITRKVVKQPVMTNVYGVTRYGAQQQIKKQLIELLPKDVLEGEVTLNQLATYAAGQTFSALAKMFNGAHLIQRWLGDCGGRISTSITPEQIERILARRRTAQTAAATSETKSSKRMRSSIAAATEDYQFKSSIVWTTPLGMPVVQPYRRHMSKEIETSFQKINLQIPRASDPVHKRKQLQAFPPNFIHSLDATHMMLSALKSDELGLTFTAVHDSFWTHAADVPTMNRVLRDAFVRMHSEDIIGRLREEFEARYKGCFQWCAIKRHSSLGKKIYELRQAKGYKNKVFFEGMPRDAGPVDELLEEYERSKLLLSDDPADVERAKKMITPYALLEAESDPESFLSGKFEDETQTLSSPAPHEPPAADVEALADLPVDSPLVDENEFADLGEESEEEEMMSWESIFDRGARGTPVDLSSGTSPFQATVSLSAPKSAGFHTASPASAPSRAASVKVAESKKAASKVKKVRANVKMASGNMHLWMPLKFKPAPPKGGFDVQSLKDSQYFFS